MGGTRDGDRVRIEGICTGSAEFGGLVTGAGVDTGADTGVGVDTGVNTGAVGTLLMVKHSSTASRSQKSSVTIATSGITLESATVELTGNVADVLHKYRIPSFPYRLKGLSKLKESSSHSKYKSL